MFKTPHMLVTLYRSTRVIQRLHKERNFNVKNEGDLMNQIVEKVVSRKLTNDQIINEVIADHTIEFPLNWGFSFSFRDKYTDYNETNYISWKDKIMINIVKELKELLNIKRKYYILNVLVAEGYGILGLKYEAFIDEALRSKTDEEVIDDLKELIEKSRELLLV